MITRQLDGNFDMLFGHSLDDYLRDAYAVAQNIKTRLLLILGEWFLDITQGVAWNELLTKPADTTALEAAIRTTIDATQGVVGITQFALTLDSAARKAKIDVTVQTIYGSQVGVQVGSL